MKRVIFTLATLAFLGLSMNSALAQGGTTGPLTWQLTGNTLTISGNGAMPDYDYAPWYEYREFIETVVLETNVTRIGNSAFRDCISLNSINIPNSVTTIGDDAFHTCMKLTSITIPDNVTNLGKGVFSWCKGLISIAISNSVTSIEQHAFSFCTNLTSITIPNSVVTIGKWAFNSCERLTSITIPNGVSSIGIQSFVNCKDMTSIIVSSTVTSIGDDAFSRCTSLTTIDVDSENKSYTSENGVLFNKSKTSLICYPAGKMDMMYVIPHSVISIEYAAFSYCTNLTLITIPNSVTTIGGNAFWCCTGLTSMILPSSITIIEGGFTDCLNLISITNLNLVPIAIKPYVFNNFNISACTLTVPTSAVSAYKAAEVWKEFDIVGGGILVNPVSGNSEYGYTIGNGLYEGGGRSTATVTAVPLGYNKFVNWTKNGVVVSTNNEYSFTVIEDVELVANFEKGDVAIVETDNYPSLRVYPNPVNGELHIGYAICDNAICDIVIYDLMGRRVATVETGRAPSLQSTSPETTIDVSHLMPGIYFLKIGEKTAKFVKE